MSDHTEFDDIEARYDASQLALSDGSSTTTRLLHRLSASANDVPGLLDLARKQQAALERVEALTDEIAKGSLHSLLNRVIARDLREALEPKL